MKTKAFRDKYFDGASWPQIIIGCALGALPFLLLISKI